ncbi:MAG TPA: nitroreductase family protein [Anaerolineaceae bacterium]|jgi:hypothetical protein
MNFTQPITETILNRFSCRTYLSAPIPGDIRQKLEEVTAGLQSGPFGTPLRYQVMAATDQERKALRGLGTYGFIKNPSGFLVGALRPQAKDLEDFGYALEELVLVATELGLGSCWLGGTFTRSGFADKIAVTREERMPAVVSLGLISDIEQARQAPMRRRIGSDSRLPWEGLFFEERFGDALSHAAAGSYAQPLEMVRVAPSASNKQPWRILHQGGAWHFYLHRITGYPGTLANTLMKIDDLPRVDMGIAMCHFALTARELGLAGEWAVREPALEKPDGQTEYTVSWIPAARL